MNNGIGKKVIDGILPKLETVTNQSVGVVEQAAKQVHTRKISISEIPSDKIRAKYLSAQDHTANVMSSATTAKPSADVVSFRVKTLPSEDFELYEKIHHKRMALFSTSEPMPAPAKVSMEKINMMKHIQEEPEEFVSLQEKMRKGIELNANERNFYERIVSQMDATTQERTLWRSVTPYEGFEEEIKTGKYKFKGLTSTSSRYSDFFEFWDGCDYDGKAKRMICGYMLQITVPKGKKLLDCNAVAENLMGKTIHTRMNEEVILPECVAQVTGIDNVLNIIKMRLL